MKRLAVYAASLLLVVSVVAAQDRSRRETDRNDRLSRSLRTGQYADARRLIDEMLALEARDDLKNIRAMFGNGPNMRVRHGSSSFRCDVRDTGVSLPLTVEGKPAQWLADTGANVSVISDAEASRLGLVIHESDGRISDLAGGAATVRIAIGRRVAIGNTQFDGVLFLVTPADQMPWKEVPVEQQGILGLPVIIGFDAFRWTRDGMCHTGSRASDGSIRGLANINYDGGQVITKVRFDDRDLEFVLDTGNQSGTQLWERFGKEFEPLVKARGRAGSARVTQFGGAADRATTVIDDLRLRVGGKDTALLYAQLYSKPVGDDRLYGLLGMDILSQAQEVTIDFRSMKLVLR